MQCGDEVRTLLANYSNAFLLLLQIAMRTIWKHCPITGMKDGLRSRRVYHMSIEWLEKCKLAVIQGDNRGTHATLTATTIFSITSKSGTGTATTQQQTRNGQATTNHTDIQNVLSTIHTHNRATIEEVTAFCGEIGLPATDGEFRNVGCQKNFQVLSLPQALSKVEGSKGRARRHRAQGVMTEWMDILDLRKRGTASLLNIPTGLRNIAKGCRESATLGESAKYLPSQSSRNPNKPTSVHDYLAL